MITFIPLQDTNGNAMVIAVDDISCIIQKDSGSTIWLKSESEVVIETNEDLLSLTRRIYKTIEADKELMKE